MMESQAYEILREEFGKEALEKGIQQGMCQFLLEALEFKFGIIPPELVKSVNSITDTESLKKLHHFAMECESLQEFERAIKLIVKN